MKFDNWNYDKQGDFWRGDSWCLGRNIVVNIDEPMTRVEPRTTLPTQFRSNKRHPFEMQTGCITGNYLGNCVEGVDYDFYSSKVFRTPDDSSLDIVVRQIGGENLIQRLPDGGIARWISWPPPWQKAKTRWYGLWRIEYPDGRIERFLPELYSDSNQAYASYLAKENGKNGTSEKQPDGSVLLKDGGGRHYAKVVGDKFYPYAIPIGTPKGTIDYESRGWDYAGYGKGGGQALIGEGWTKDNGFEWAPQSKFYNSPDYARLESILRISKKAILAMRPSEVVTLYYSTGQFENYLDNRLYQPRYKGGLVPLYGTDVFLIETIIRQRLYAFRPDLYTVKLSDGSVVPGLINWAIFPPTDGLTCSHKKSGWDKFRDALDVVGATVASLIPGVGQLMALGITYANAKEKQRVLAEQMKLMETGRKFLELSQGAQAGTAEIIAKDPPSRADIEQQARAAGEPVPTAVATAGGGIGILLLGAALLAIA